MKKLLLGTTALIGAAALFGADAFAAAPKVTLGGFVDFQAGVVDEDLDAGKSDFDAQNDSELKVSVDGTSDHGLGYGAVVELEADVGLDADGEGLNADKTYLYMQGNWGRTEMGANWGVAKTMKVDASTFARATGGVDGDWYDFVTVPAAGFVQTPDLLLDMTGATEDATKITYYTPRFSGIQLGASYIPDTGDTGQAPFSGDVNLGDAENVFVLGANYQGQWNNWGVALSATGEFGESESAALEDLSTYALGGSVNVAGFTVGGSWADLGDSLNAANTESEFWTAGATYAMGPFGVGLSYLDSESGTSEFNNVVLGADYQLAAGLVPYVEVHFFEYDAAGAALDNDGTAVLLGSQLTF
jgi:outer membrane protein OmpU